MARQATARKTRIEPVEDVEVLLANAEVQLIAPDESIISTWMKNLTGFFRHATELETAARNFEAESKTWTMPTNGSEDAQMQMRVKTATAAIKTAEEHWSICQALSRLHRKMTTKRGVTVTALENASRVAQGFHNRWVDAERRRVQEEEDRLRREEEQRQRAEQERRARELEEQALASEASSAGLSSREELFVEMVWQGLATPADAARSCGYKDPARQGARLMETEKIKGAIKAKQDAESARKQAAAIRQQPVAVEIARPAMDVQREGTDRTTWSGEIVDEMATVMAFRAGTHGIPPDLFQINPAKLNEYARSLHERLDLWPGVRAKKTTRTV